MKLIDKIRRGQSYWWKYREMDVYKEWNDRLSIECSQAPLRMSIVSHRFSINFHSSTERIATFVFVHRFQQTLCRAICYAPQVNAVMFSEGLVIPYPLKTHCSRILRYLCAADDSRKNSSNEFPLCKNTAFFENEPFQSKYVYHR